VKERGVIVSFDWLVIWSAISEWEGLVFLGVGLGIDLSCPSRVRVDLVDICLVIRGGFAYFRLMVVCIDGWMITCELWWFFVELWEFLLFSLMRHGSDWTLRGWVSGEFISGGRL